MYDTVRGAADVVVDKVYTGMILYDYFQTTYFPGKGRSGSWGALQTRQSNSPISGEQHTFGIPPSHQALWRR